MTTEGPTVMAHLLPILKQMKKRRVLLVGDMVADHYIYGRTSRISREAPVLILKYQDEYVVPGQAANTATNIASLGGVVTAIGLIGEDGAGKSLKKAMRARGVGVDALIQAKNYPTLTKTRILAGGHHTCRQQVIRIDNDDRIQPDEATQKKVIAAMRRQDGSCDAVVVSDYGYGLVSEAVWNEALTLKTKLGVPLILDSRYQLPGFHGATLITPNEQEALECAGVVSEDDYEIENVGKTLLRKTGAEAVLVTRGNEGMALFRPKQTTHHLGIFGTDEVTDVTGAGDTVVATAALALAAGAELPHAAEIANVAAGIVVMKMGTASVSFQELEAAVSTGKPPLRTA